MGFRNFPMRKQRFLRKGIAFVTHFFIFFRNGCQPHINIHVSSLLSTNWADYIFSLKNFVFCATSFAGLINGGGQAEANRRRNH